MTSLILGDVLEELPKLSPNLFDAVLTDPPYGLGTQGKSWDGIDIEAATRRNRMADQHVSRASEAGQYDVALSGMHHYQEWCYLWGHELHRVVKPGGCLLAFGSPRTYHRLVCGLEDAGWYIRDSIQWLFGSGFPKSLDIARAIDEHLGAERQVLGTRRGVGTCPEGFGYRTSCPITLPATDSAKRWQGYGTALKPGYEPVVVAMKRPQGSYAQNALMNDVAGLNLDACRSGRTTEERFPANVILGHHIACIDGAACNPDCPIARLGERARFFYCAKPSQEEKNAGLTELSVERKCHLQTADGTGKRWEGMSHGFPDTYVPIHHPTVKPIALTEYLATLILPPLRAAPRRLLVPFCGSGSEMLGAMRTGWEEIIGIDNHREYLELARNRIGHAQLVASEDIHSPEPEITPLKLLRRPCRSASDSSLSKRSLTTTTQPSSGAYPPQGARRVATVCDM